MNDSEFNRILLHAVGMGRGIVEDNKFVKNGRQCYKCYRNSYVSNANDNDCLELEKLGMLKRASKTEIMIFWQVTKAGFDEIEKITGYRCVNDESY